MKTKNIQLRSHINERSAQLRHIAAELKTELFGIDDIIEKTTGRLQIIVLDHALMATQIPPPMATSNSPT